MSESGNKGFGYLRKITHERERLFAEIVLGDRDKVVILVVHQREDVLRRAGERVIRRNVEHHGLASAQMTLDCHSNGRACYCYTESARGG